MAFLLTTGLTVSDYCKNGGVLEFELDALEVGGNSNEFETFHSLKYKLHTGFELPPTVIIHDPEILALIMASCDSWTKFHAYTYARKGSIVYKRLHSGLYNARCEWN
ncbi:hypothetical protein [Buttiauxella gaviniae]|uniref:hypothetical protein n=1 Tax=Buttiauxella gaviniae TaxID=82990 RepID=UPI003C765664